MQALLLSALTVVVRVGDVEVAFPDTIERVIPLDSIGKNNPLIQESFPDSDERIYCGTRRMQSLNISQDTTTDCWPNLLRLY